MSNTERSPAILPNHLKSEYVRSIPVDSPRFIHPNFIYQGDEGHVFLDASDYLEPRTRVLAKRKGRVAIMLTMLQTGETGYVADMRFIKDGDQFYDAPGDEAPEDNEDATIWEKDKANARPVYAIISRDPETGVDEPAGDADFYDAAKYLAEQVDAARKALKIEKQRALKPTSAKPNHPIPAAARKS